MRRSGTNPAERLRFTVDTLPTRTKEAMIRGIDSSPIIVGAYVDKHSGGVCPMLAAHRNGGRTSLASFARAWDRYTGARRPRLANRRELRALRAMLDASLANEYAGETTSVAELAAQIRAERASAAPSPERIDSPEVPEPSDGVIEIHRAPETDRHRARELRARLRWSWLRPSRRYDEYRDLLAAAEEQLSEQRADELLGERPASHPRV